MKTNLNTIKIISASAGSGKTHRLADVLEEAVKNKCARPQAIIATSFTIKAAAELRERVRKRLLKAGLIDEAQQLRAANMGTVNSVCSRLVSDFAFELGLSPEIRVLDEEMADKALRNALSGAMDKDADLAIAHIETTFTKWNVEKLISRVVELARANGLDAQSLAESRDRNNDELKDILARPLDPDEVTKFEKDLEAAIASFLAHVASGIDQTKKTKSAAETARKFLSTLKAGKNRTWQEWHSLSTLEAAKKSEDAAEHICNIAGGHFRLPSFHDDLASAVSTVFDLAARTLACYADYKKERGLIDFVDQECLALELLDNPAVRSHLEGEVDLVLIDEFQDTSPIQLAIFLKLAGISKHSVWVGDQKQSIFGFRGSDPELMNTAIKTILDGREPETLPLSWRSRPGLVDLTSNLFAAAFPAHGIPASRVRLEAALKDTEEPQNLGPYIERWIPYISGPSNKKKRAAAIAAAIKECLAIPPIQVRDRITGEARNLKPRDIAVLCRRNSTCADVSRNLNLAGIKSTLARRGLMKTPEARLMLAALRLWSDPEDALSAAEIALMLEYPGDPNGWLAGLLEKTGLAAFEDFATISRLRSAAAAERSGLGVLAAFDRIAELLPIRDVCRRWGNAAERLDNLNVLRAFAVRYTAISAQEGAGMTPAGLSAYLADLNDEKSNTPAFSPDADAVVISTWHRAKGLEWPVVILYELESDFSRNSLDIQVVSDKEQISLDDPLAERWIRYWPNPYHFQSKTDFHTMMREKAAFQQAVEVDRRESLRLLYVGWTRARDRVVLVCPEDNLDKGMLSELKLDDTPLLSEPAGGKANWCGKEISVFERSPSPAESSPIRPESEPVFDLECPKDHPPAKAWPDMPGRTWTAGEPKILGAPISLRAPADMMDMGNAVHGFLAADSPAHPQSDRIRMAQDLLKRWGVENALNPEDLLEIGDRLHKWAVAEFPNAKRRREWPTLLRLESGSVAHGVADLILETPEGLAIVDHKAYPGTPADARDFALSAAPQVQVYADTARQALGKPLVSMSIHLPLIGALVEIHDSSHGEDGPAIG